MQIARNLVLVAATCGKHAPASLVPCPLPDFLHAQMLDKMLEWHGDEAMLPQLLSRLEDEGLQTPGANLFARNCHNQHWLGRGKKWPSTKPKCL